MALVEWKRGKFRYDKYADEYNFLRYWKMSEWRKINTKKWLN